jgi:hypothetical protein
MNGRELARHAASILRLRTREGRRLALMRVPAQWQPLVRREVERQWHARRARRGSR